MAHVQLAHTADLSPDDLDACQALLLEVFEGDFGDEDWEHSVGGIHVLVREGTQLLGHGSVVQRRLLHGGRALRTGYVEGVGVRPDRQGHGLGGTLMDALEGVIRRAYDLGALGATDRAAGFYAARGWQLWRGPTSALTPRGIERTEEEDGAIYVLPVVFRLDLDGAIACDWRDGDVW